MATTSTARRRFEEALAAAEAKRGRRVYVVGIGGVAGISLKGERVLRTPGERDGRPRSSCRRPTRSSQLVHTALADDVQNRYLLTYTPSNQTHDGSWRVSTSTAGSEVSRSDARRVLRARSRRRSGRSSSSRPPIPRGQYLEVTADDLEVVETACAQKVETFHEAVATGVDRPRARRQRQHAATRGARSSPARAAFVAALRPEDSSAS